MALCSILHLRKWKYDESVIQHWVETRQHGSLIQIEGEKTEEVTSQEANSAEGLSVNLNFDEGPGNGEGGASSGLLPEGAMPVDAACKQVCRRVNAGF